VADGEIRVNSAACAQGKTLGFLRVAIENIGVLASTISQFARADGEQRVSGLLTVLVVNRDVGQAVARASIGRPDLPKRTVLRVIFPPRLWRWQLEFLRALLHVSRLRGRRRSPLRGESERPQRRLCVRAAASLFSIALLASACTSTPRPVIAPIPAHAIPVGINAAWHGYSLDDFQFCPALIRTPQTSGAALGAFLTAVPAGCPVLALIEAPDVKLVEDFARERPTSLELGNELELRPYELTPTQYGDWIFRAVTVLKAADYRGTIVMGAVYALTDETKQAIRIGIARCIDAGMPCVVGVHLYDASDEDLQWLRDLDWPVWVTEVGYPVRCDPTRAAQQSVHLQAQIARFSTVPKLAQVILYQRLSGATCSDLDTFGLTPRSQELLR
jgi:hypothetical protein